MTVTLFLLALPAHAHELPDPGRRLSKEEQEGKPAKSTASKPGPAGRARDAQACERARTYYQGACGVPESRRSRGMQCAEAYALYRQSCP